ncbi:MAG: zinc ribbon domain-containing protein [Thiomonas sp. 14-64-326]|nr:MAG: zinc ribbon domain-containing protein [Thiomonas sp. 14-64-326]
MTVKTTNNLGVLLRSYEALHNWRALAVLAGSFVLGGLAISGGAAAGMSSGSAAVSMLMGRIPGIGGFLGFLLGGPLVVVVALAYAVLLLAGPLMIAAVWHGEGFIASLSRAVGIVTQRPLEVFMHFLVLGLLVFPAVAFIFAVVFVGSMFVGGFFAAGSFGGMGMGGFGGMGGMGGFGGMRGMEGVALGGAGMGGAGLSIGLVWFLAWSVVSLIYVLGMIFVYRAVSEGVESAGSEQIGQKLAQFKQKLDDYKPRPAPVAPPPPAPSAPPAEPPAPSPEPTSPAQVADTTHCPACGAAVQPDDVFCGSCGHRLK